MPVLNQPIRPSWGGGKLLQRPIINGRSIRGLPGNLKKKEARLRVVSTPILANACRICYTFCGVYLTGCQRRVCATNAEHMNMRNTNAKTDEDIFDMQRIQKHLQKIKGILVMMVMCGLFFSVPSTAQGFIARTSKALDILLDKIDRPQWKIGYNFTADCPEAFRQQEAQLKEAITKALQTWLQPLRARYPNRQFT